ncbi:uncharacterized protein [Lepisosteus oculatus]|uniref:uncharacterized protein n=1 Tax=Lepisosteus oculatus TaxID=7918 RepID=UPI0037215A85
MAWPALRALLLLALLRSALSLNVTAPPEVWGFLHSPSLLPCSFSGLGGGSEEGEGLLGLGVSWSRNGTVLASFGSEGNVSAPGWSLAGETELRDGNASLTLRNTSILHQGEYQCTVSNGTGTEVTANTTLLVLAPPRVRVPPVLALEGRESAVRCEAEGFHPAPILFSWLQAGRPLGAPQSPPAARRPDGTYRAAGELRWTPGAADTRQNFSCRVAHAALQQPMRVDFTLQFPRQPVVSLSVEPVPQGQPQPLSCQIEGFFPGPVTVTWLLNGSGLTDSSPAQQRADGTFRTTRYHTLSPEQRERGGEVWCLVSQPGVQSPVSTSILITRTEPAHRGMSNPAKASVALMIISLVLVVLLGFGFSWRRRDEKKKGLSVSGIILPVKIVVGRKAVLTCCIQGRLVDMVQTTWFVNDKPITSNSSSGNGDRPALPLSARESEAPLLPPACAPGYYRVKTQRPLLSSRRKEKQLLSHLSFLPDLRLHRGALFKCQVSYRGKESVMEERVSDRITLLAAPCVSDIRVAPDSGGTLAAGGQPGAVQLEVVATRFHPGLLTVRWFCEGGELSPAESSSEPQPDPDGFFQAVSQCRVPLSELNRPGFRVWVTVHHMALRDPITRESRGLVKSPEVSEISASEGTPGQPLTLGCQMSGFYPPEIKVHWLRVHRDQEEALSEGLALWGPIETHPYIFRASAQASVPDRGTEGGNGGSLIKCIIEHSSLERPLERQWRHTCTAVPSIPDALEVHCEEGGLRVFSVVLRGGYPRGGAVHWAGGVEGGALWTLKAENSELSAEDGTPELHSCCSVDRWAVRTLTNGQTQNEANRKDAGQRLTVLAEITHPALTLPVFRTWTEPIEESS